MEKHINYELFVLRCVACLSILLMHAFERVYHDGNDAVNAISLLLSFGTPTFVFISEMIMSFSYPSKLPGQFWSKRVKLILLPYIIFGALYAAIKAFDVSGADATAWAFSFLHLLWRHILLADYHGYFILIIFQFYLLHRWLQPRIHRYSPKKVVAVSFAITLLYLGFFNFVQPADHPVLRYIWSKLCYVLLPGWLIYFMIAYYCGRALHKFKQNLSRYAVLVCAAPVFFGGIVLTFYETGLLRAISSKRVDMVFFTLSLTFFVYWMAMKLKSVPKPVELISQYSFGIYLLHPLYQGVLYQGLTKFGGVMYGPLFTVVLFLGGLLLSAVTMHVANVIPFGKYVVGRIGIGAGGSRKTKEVRSEAAVVNP